MGKLILIRHGESEANRQRRFGASREIPLTEQGRQQAHQAAATVVGLFRPVRLIASPHVRTVETAKIIAASFDLTIEIEEALRERELGVLAGQSFDAMRNDPTFDRAHPWRWKPEGGESQEEVRARVAPLLADLIGFHPDDELLLVTHAAVIMAAIAEATGEWTNIPVPKNCGVALIEYVDGRFSSHRLITD